MPDTGTETLLFASESDDTRRLADALGADLATLPALDRPEDFEAWRADAVAGPPAARVVVAVWPTPPSPASLVETDADAWRARFELPYLLWNVALGAAGRRVAEGGVVVALCRMPAALDAAGLVPETAIADGVLALARSVGAAEGIRGVRAHLVTTPIGLVERPTCLPMPALPDAFPGRIEDEVAGTIRLLLSDEARGLTGRWLAADGGRTL